MDVIEVALALRSSRRLLKSQPIHAVLAAMRAAPTARRPARDDLVARATRFALARRYAPSKPNCLTDSIALIQFLGPAACRAILVFGVKLDPFAAHCWVQRDKLLLNDRIDYIERFQPVRTVECSRVTR